MSSEKNEESFDDSRDETKSGSGQRKRSLVERFVRVLFSNETNESHLDDSTRKTQLSEVTPDDTSKRPVTGYRFSCCVVMLHFLL